MLPIKYILENRDEVIEHLKVKNIDATETIDKIIELNDKRRKTQAESDNLQAELNRISKEIGLLMKNGQKEQAELQKQRTNQLKQ